MPIEHYSSKYARELKYSLVGKFGPIKGISPIETRWASSLKPNPQILEFESNSVVLRYLPDTSALSFYADRINAKNKPDLLVSPIISAASNFLVTEYIRGYVLADQPDADLSRLGILHSKFYGPDKVEKLDFWNQLVEDAINALVNSGSVSKQKIPGFQFTQFGFIHGDFHPGNVICSDQSRVLIDLEHVMEGPLAYDIARPLAKIGPNVLQKSRYLEMFPIQLDKEEIFQGELLFYLLQAYRRQKWGFEKEAGLSIRRFLERIGPSRR